jgi:hypothetical protein
MAAAQLATSVVQMNAAVAGGTAAAGLTATGAGAAVGVPVLAVSGSVAITAAGNAAAGAYNMAKAIERGKNSKSVNEKPSQEHHFATDKNKKFSPEMEKIADKYGLDLDDAWNKEFLPHQGRHPDAYHQFVLEEMRAADVAAAGDRPTFLRMFEQNVKDVVRQNPGMLTKEWWR